MGNFRHGIVTCSRRKFALSFSLNFLSIFVRISGSIRPITLIWMSLETFFFSCRNWLSCCQFWLKMMASDVEQRPRLFTAGYLRHVSQWVKLRTLER